MSCAVCTRDVCAVLCCPVNCLLSSAFVLASCQTCTPDNENYYSASITTTWLRSLIDISIDTHDTYDDNDDDDDDINWSTTTLGLWWLYCQLHLETWDLMWYYTLCRSQSTLYTCCCCCCWWWCWWWWWWFDTGYNGHGSAVMLVLLLILVIMTDSGSQ